LFRHGNARGVRLATRTAIIMPQRHATKVLREKSGAKRPARKDRREKAGAKRPARKGRREKAGDKSLARKIWRVTSGARRHATEVWSQHPGQNPRRSAGKRSIPDHVRPHQPRFRASGVAAGAKF
jgi:hypothetical protein